MRRLNVLAAVLFFCFQSFASAQDKRPPIHRADQISMTIDVLWNARASVTKYPLDQRIKLYSIVSVRLTQCGLLYAVINKEAPAEKKDAQTSASFDGISWGKSSPSSAHNGEVFPEARDIGSRMAAGIRFIAKSATLQAEFSYRRAAGRARACVDGPPKAAVCAP